MVQRMTNIVDEDHAVGYGFKGHLIPLTEQNLEAMEIRKATAKKVFALYKKLGDEVFAAEANCREDDINDAFFKLVDEFMEAYGIEPEVLFVQEDAHDMSEGLEAGKAYLCVDVISKEDEGVWEIIKRHCPDAFYATWWEYEG